MQHASLLAILIVSTLAAGCGFENTSKLVSPTAPGSASGGSTTSGSTPSPAPASGFGGAWGSSSIAGLPIGSCADVKWLITQQSATSIGGTMSATCAGGATVSATLNGRMSSESTMNLTAAGTILAMGIPCAFNLTGVGTRQANDTMKLDYQGTHCLGNVSGTDTLRRFPV